MVTCLACGRENPQDARFCNGCGGALGPAPESRREERKIVTVLFADLVGFTSRAERLDPEDVRALLAPYWQHLRAELERHGGTVEKFIGDAVMALFGAPVAHEDDPERAVRAALAIRHWVDESGEELQVRLAVNTGEALVLLGARPGEGEGMATGDVVNTAARLQAAAPVNGVLVGEATYRATRHLVQYRSAEPVVAKGKAKPLAVWEALHARSRVSFEPASAGPLVGRSRELELLVGSLDRARREREPQLVTVVGVPGIGKSRLVAELAATLEADQEIVSWRYGRSLPYGETASFWALGEIVKAQVGVLESDARAEAETKLGETMQQLLDDDAERAWVGDHLRPLLGLQSDDARGDTQREESFAAWRRFVEALAHRRTLVLAFEDLQWADDDLLDFVDQLVEWVSGVPLLVLCTARPELLERRPAWGGGKRNAATVSLAPLADDETARVVAAALDQALLPAEIQAAVLSRAAGNPLYAEQYARMVAEGLDTNAELPETVQGIIAARLDLLPLEEKALLQDAAVMGRVFWPEALAEIGGTSRPVVEERLQALVRKEFVRRESRSSLAGTREYLFAHGLVRDVAYSQIPRGARSDKHLRAAAWIETLPPDRAADRADLLAHHYTAALELGNAAGRDVAALAAPARLALREAGDRAVALGAYPVAMRHYSAALELTQEGGLEHARLLFSRGSIRVWAGGAALDDLKRAIPALLAGGDVEAAAQAESSAAEACWYAGDREAADAHADRALALVEARPPSPAKADALAQRARLLMLAGDDRSFEVATQALELADALGLERLQASALITRGTSHGMVGASVDDLRRGIEIAERGKIHSQLFRGLNNLGEHLMASGEIAAHDELYARMRREAEQLGFAAQLRWIDGQECGWRYVRGDWDRARDLADSIIALVDAGEAHYHESSACWVRALIRHAREDTGAQALADAERGTAAARRSEEPQVLVPNLAVTALLLAREGRRREAAAVLEELLALCAGGRLPYFAAPAVLWAAAELGRAAELDPLARREEGNRWLEAVAAGSAGDFAEAHALFAEIGLAADAAEAAAHAAAQLLDRGDRIGADEMLAAARGFFRQVGATRRLRATDALLSATA